MVYYADGYGGENWAHKPFVEGTCHTLHTWHNTLPIPNFTMHTWHNTLLTTNFTLHTWHNTLLALHTWHSISLIENFKLIT